MKEFNTVTTTIFLHEKAFRGLCAINISLRYSGFNCIFYAQNEASMVSCEEGKPVGEKYLTCFMDRGKCRIPSTSYVKTMHLAERVERGLSTYQR
jgi:hypothetical protein